MNKRIDTRERGSYRALFLTQDCEGHFDLSRSQLVLERPLQSNTTGSVIWRTIWGPEKGKNWETRIPELFTHLEDFA